MPYPHPPAGSGETPSTPTPTMGGAADSSEEELLQFLYQSPIGLLQTTLDGEITMINPVSAQLLMPLAPSGHLANLFDTLQSVAPQLRHLPASCKEPVGSLCESLRIVVPGPRVDGLPTTKDLAIRLVKLGANKLMASVTDISLAVQQEQARLVTRLRDAERVDRLTSMPNRTVVLERLAVAQATAEREPDYQFAVLFINGDRFSSVNVTWGAAAGDDLLRLMAGRLRGALRAGNDATRGPQPVVTTARLGADEFVVVLERLRREDDVRGIAQRLVLALCKPYSIGGNQVHATASIGVLMRKHAQGDADAVLQEASLAMREAKRTGGARYRFFEPEMKERAQRRGNLEGELRNALAANELFVVYQPIVDLNDDRVAGVEALVRWQHPVRGIVSPIEFIEIAEETGLIGPLGEFVLRTACHAFVRWQRLLGAKAPRMLSVNLSRAQLVDPLLVQMVQRALQSSGLAPEHLQLEVTESLAAQGEHVLNKLHELKGLGLALALDDFGTGYSSLASLHLMPVDVVKIDRSFVSQSESSLHHRVLIEATVRVARSLGMRTVAEGIETEGQANVLAELECDKGQGYLYAKPLSAEAAADWLSAYRGIPAGLTDTAGTAGTAGRTCLARCRRARAAAVHD